MTAITRNPLNPNFLSPDSFKFYIKKLPQVNFFVDGVGIPGISIPPAKQPTAFVELPASGEHPQYDELQITFKVDEDLNNWLELHTWLRGLGFPRDFDEYANLVSPSKIQLGEGKASDAVVYVLNSQRNINYSFTFLNAFPVGLTGFHLTATASDVDYVVATASFKYDFFEVEVLRAGA